MTTPVNNPLELARFGTSLGPNLTWRIRAEVGEYVDVSGTVEDIKEKNGKK